MEPNPYESPSPYDASSNFDDARPSWQATLLFGLYIGGMIGATITPAALAVASLISAGGNVVAGVYLSVVMSIVGCFAGAATGSVVGVLLAAIDRAWPQRPDTPFRVIAVVLMGLPISFLWATMIPDRHLSTPAYLLQGMIICFGSVLAGKWLHFRLKRFLQP